MGVRSWSFYEYLVPEGRCTSGWYRTSSRCTRRFALDRRRKKRLKQILNGSAAISLLTSYLDTSMCRW